MSAYVQLVDPGGRFEHREGTLTGDVVLRLPLDKRVERALQARILRKVEAPAAEPAPKLTENKDSDASPTVPETGSTPADAGEAEAGGSGSAAAPATTKKSATKTSAGTTRPA